MSMTLTIRCHAQPAPSPFLVALCDERRLADDSAAAAAPRAVTVCTETIRKTLTASVSHDPSRTSLSQADCVRVRDVWD